MPKVTARQGFSQPATTRAIDDEPMALTAEERALIMAWLDDQTETWANVGDRPMLSAIATLREQAEEAAEVSHVFER